MAPSEILGTPTRNSRYVEKASRGRLLLSDIGSIHSPANQQPDGSSNGNMLTMGELANLLVLALIELDLRANHV